METVLCNCCGKKIIVLDGIVREGVVSWNPMWDYFSERDGEVHHLDICEDCYNSWIKQFRIAIEIEDTIELL